jgi:hypothetical protein
VRIKKETAGEKGLSRDGDKVIMSCKDAAVISNPPSPSFATVGVLGVLAVSALFFCGSAYGSGSRQKYQCGSGYGFGSRIQVIEKC